MQFKPQNEEGQGPVKKQTSLAWCLGMAPEQDFTQKFVADVVSAATRKRPGMKSTVGVTPAFQGNEPIEKVFEGTPKKGSSSNELLEYTPQKKSGPDQFLALRGGRPNTPSWDLRGVRGGDMSNNRYPGQEPRRSDVQPWQGLSICQFLKAQRDHYAHEKEYWRAMCARYRPMTREVLKGILRKEKLFQKKVDKLQQGSQGGARKGARCRQTPNDQGAVRATRGCRDEGAGRKDIFKQFKEKVKDFAIRERNYGHTLTQEDLWIECRINIEEAIGVIELRASQGKLSEGDASLVVEYKTRLLKIANSRSYLKHTKRELMLKAGTRMLKPQRKLNISPQEEEVRCQCTWQDWYYKMWVVAFGDADQLAEFVHDPNEFMKDRKKTVVGTNDQVPLWIHLTAEKQLYLDTEIPQSG